MQIEIVIDDAQKMIGLGEQLGKQAESGDLFFLFGDLGTGKTTLTQGIARGLAITEPVSSPTFQLMKSYQGSLLLNHLDLYRLKSQDELDVLEPEELIETGVTVVEWGALLLQRLQPEYLRVEIETVPGESGRIVRIIPYGCSYYPFVERLNHAYFSS